MSEQLSDRELDAAIAQRVFGKRTRKVRYLEGYSWPKGKLLDDATREANFAEALVEEMEDGEILYVDYDCKPRLVANSVPRYSLHIADAWRIVAHLRTDWRFNFQDVLTDKWRAVFSNRHFHDLAFGADDYSAETAICRAALLAVDWRASSTRLPDTP